VLALLFLGIIASGTLILLPLATARWRKTTDIDVQGASQRPKTFVLIYFALIGIGFLFIEIPLIQRYILFLGNPAYAMTAVLFSLLLFSGIGSQWSSRVPTQLAMGGLALILAIYPAALPALFNHMLGLPLNVKLVLGCLILAPIGFLMGIPFPSGVRLLSTYKKSEIMIPWAWGVNGAASVVSSILAALLALSWDSTWSCICALLATPAHGSWVG
jgi:hypothetical protein